MQLLNPGPYSTDLPIYISTSLTSYFLLSINFQYHGRLQRHQMTTEHKGKPVFPSNAGTKEYAESLDAADPLHWFRDKFIIPSKANLKTMKLAKPGLFCILKTLNTLIMMVLIVFFEGLSSEPSIYFCGHSLGLQPKATAKYIEAHLDTWSSIGVGGHFTDLEDSPLKQWQLLADYASSQMSRLVGASPEEVAAMGTLTMNLHFLLASFYKPTKEKYKILLDWKAFPSDHVRSSHPLQRPC